MAEFELFLSNVIQIIGWTFDIIGVLFMVIGAIISSIFALRELISNKPETHDLFRSYRQDLARSVLIGLEFLVIGDTIRTVAGNLTIEGIVVLAGIVAIRIALGITLEAEINGEWPRWRHLLRRPRKRK